jgi:alpha-1,6-mannosyltransferase
VLIYAGRLSTEKRVLTLLAAFERLPSGIDAQLWIVGDGPLRDNLEMKALPNPAVRLLPYEQDRNHFAELLASADVYVTAGPHETFGLSVIEAQASGLPVVGVDAGALRERVPVGTGCLANVDDPDSIAAAISNIAPARRLIGDRARRHVERHFAWRNTFETLVQLYMERVTAPANRALAH